MKLLTIGRLAGVIVMTATLAGCIDVTMDVKVKSETEAQGTMIQTIGAQFYPMLKASQTANGKDTASFCKQEDGGTLVENADGSATCTIVKQGKFADLGFDDGKEKVNFTSAGPGLVKVSFPTAEFSEGLNKATAGAGTPGAADDAKTKAAMEQMKVAMTTYFAGHFLTIRIDGGEITDTNLTLAADKQSAETKIPFTDIISGTTKLPAELYAVVKVN
jgi:hypothetical protein